MITYYVKGEIENEMNQIVLTQVDTKRDRVERKIIKNYVKHICVLIFVFFF